MALDSLRPPHHWRLRAKESRTIAASTDEPPVQTALLVVADEYDRLEQIAERWLTGNRVSRKTTDELGTIVEVSERIKIDWDGGRTSYYRRDKPANVKLAT